MRAFVHSSIATSPTLSERPVPVPGAGEVLVRVLACGLNFADLLMLKGSYQDMPPLPFVPGLEFAGEVVARGPGVTAPALGARVAAMTGSGGLAEFAVAPAARCLELPPTMSMEQAAGFQIAYGTSHLALGHRARLAPGETLLVLGAAGGVGLTAVEIGARIGARVIASARGAERLAIARAAGAHELIDSDAPGLRDRLKDLGGVDVVYDTVGGPAFLEALRATRPEGRLLAIGFAGGEVPQIPANLLLVKNLSVIGLYWGGYLKFRPEVLTESLSTLLGWFEAGEIRPRISHVLPLDRVEEALALLSDRKATGKVVVAMT